MNDLKCLYEENETEIQKTFEGVKHGTNKPVRILM